MTVRFRIALTVFLTGLAAAAGVATTMVVAFQRFQHETTYERANAFLDRVVMQNDDLLEQAQRDADGLVSLLRNLLLFEPDSQLYLLAPDGTVLVHSGTMNLPPGFKVAIGPVRQAVADGGRRIDPYVMGDDPERMAEGAVVAARALSHSQVRATDPMAGYIYLVCRKPMLTQGGLGMFGSSLAGPALAAALAVIAVCTCLALWIIHGVTRPLQRLSDEVAAAARDGFEAARHAPVAVAAPAAAAGDEFSRLQTGFQALLATLHAQWSRLQRVDAVRRESVSNLSHDLRSPLTATVACLETLDRRWEGQPARGDDRALVATALRNTRNAARMVRSLGDLAVLDEPAFRLAPERIDLSEVLDDIVMRFAPRAEQHGVALSSRPPAADDEPPFAPVDIELFERAVANLVDNALVHTPPGGRIELTAATSGDRVQVAVADTGSGIDAGDLPFLFDRLYQARADTAPATSEGGKGLGLAIVKRIVELHGGHIAVDSTPGRGTTVRIALPRG